MTESKYSKYVFECPMTEPRDHFAGKVNHLMVFDQNTCAETKHWFSVYQAYVEGSGHGIGNTWYHESLGKLVETTHYHDQPGDETHLFFGSDPMNPDDLGGEVDFWLGEGDDAEKFVLTKRTAIHVPAGLVHTPVYFRKIAHPPIFQVVICEVQLIPEFSEWLPEEFRKNIK